MSPENTQALIDIYPPIFSDLSEKCCMSLFGFECGDGWFELLKDLIEGIKEICESEKWDIKVNQVKEKYGTLRFYLDSTPEALSDLIEKYEKQSAHTCEECGKGGSMRKKGIWYSVRCDICWNKAYN